jgi:hypothetical protein
MPASAIDLSDLLMLPKLRPGLETNGKSDQSLACFGIGSSW